MYGCEEGIEDEEGGVDPLHEEGEGKLEAVEPVNDSDVEGKRYGAGNSGGVELRTYVFHHQTVRRQILFYQRRLPSLKVELAQTVPHSSNVCPFCG